MAKSDYTPPTPEQVNLIAQAASMTPPRADYENYFDWRFDFEQNLREITLLTREGRYRNTVEMLLSPETVAFWGTLRGIAFHENSKRYLVQIESEDAQTKEIQVQYIKTERTDTSNGDAIAELVENNIGHRARIWKHTEDGGKFKYNSIPFIEPAGPGEDISDEVAADLADELDEKLSEIGKKS